MRVHSSFFFDNCLVPGTPVLDRRGRVHLDQALQDALQLLAAGFHCKRRGQMPSECPLEDLLETSDGRLFLKRADFEWIPYDESTVLEHLQRLVRASILKGKSIADGRPLHEIMMNYPRSFSQAVDSLGAPGRTLMHFKRAIRAQCGDVPLLSHLLSWHFELPDTLSQQGIVAFPQTHVATSCLGAYGFVLPPRNAVLEGKVPFGSYNRFAGAHEFLRFPVHGDDCASSLETMENALLAFLEKNYRWTEPLRWTEREDSLDDFSFQLFQWLSDRIDLTVGVLAENPYNSGLAVPVSGDGYLESDHHAWPLMWTVVPCLPSP